MRLNDTQFKTWKIFGPEGRIGVVDDVLVDDDSWAVRYLVVAIDGGLASRKVLVAPELIAQSDSARQRLVTYIPKAGLMNCPRLEWVQPVCRQYEQALTGYLGSLAYRVGSALLSPQRMLDFAPEDVTTFVDEANPSSLRSLKEILRYKVVDRNGESARLAEINIDLETWSAKAVTIDLSFGKNDYQKSIPMNQIKDVNWSSRRLGLVRSAQLRPQLKSRSKLTWSNLSHTESAVF